MGLVDSWRSNKRARFRQFTAVGIVVYFSVAGWWKALLIRTGYECGLYLFPQVEAAVSQLPQTWKDEEAL